MKKLEGLKAAPIPDDNLHLAFIKGALDFLGIDVSSAWLAGATGHAFIIHIDKDVCLSCPWASLADAHRSGKMTALGRNVGYELDYYHADGDESGLPERQDAWDRIRQAIDRGHPCYMYHNFCLQMIGGYDDDGIYFAEDSYPWANAGQGPVSVLEHGGFAMGVVSPGRPADAATTIREGLRFALDHPDHDPACHGLVAYDNWIAAMEAGEPGGTWRASRAWASCRSLAVAFLDEAKARVPDGPVELFDEARRHYQEVAANLNPVAEAFAEGVKIVSMPPAVAAERLCAARDAEASALPVLEKIVGSI